MIVCRAAERVHDPPRAPFRRRVLRSARAVEERGAGADEGEGCVCLGGGGAGGAVLGDEGVEREFGRVEDAVKVYFDCFERGWVGWVGGAWGG